MWYSGKGKTTETGESKDGMQNVTESVTNIWDKSMEEWINNFDSYTCILGLNIYFFFFFE